MKKLNIIKYTKAYYGKHKPSANALLTKYAGWSTSFGQPIKIIEDTQIKRKLSKEHKLYDTSSQKTESHKLMALFFQSLHFYNDAKVEMKSKISPILTKFIEDDVHFLLDNDLLTDTELNKDMLVVNFNKNEINIYQKSLDIYIKETGDTSLHISENAYTKEGIRLESFSSLRIDSYKSIKVFWKIFEGIRNGDIINQ